MTRDAFASSMFELADIWTENIDEEEVSEGYTTDGGGRQDIFLSEPYGSVKYGMTSAA